MFVDENLFYKNEDKCAKEMVTLNSPLTFDAFTRDVIRVIRRLDLESNKTWVMSQFWRYIYIVALHLSPPRWFNIYFSCRLYAFM